MFFAVLHDAAAATRGEVVKTTGDGMMVVFRDSALDTVTCAARMHDVVEALDVTPPAHLRIGISAGEAALDSGDWFGTPVIEAARLCDRADPGQTLTSDVVRVLLGTRGAHGLRAIGPMILKGIAHPITVAHAPRTPALSPSRPLPHGDEQPARRHRRVWIAPVAALVVVLIAVALVIVVPSNDKHPIAAAARYTARIENVACRSSVRALVPTATCGVLSVPENRARPEGRWIQVKFVRYPARHAATTDPVVEVATALDAAEIVDDPSQSPVRDTSDLIVFGGRGLGSSVPSLTCPEFEAIAPAILRHPENDAATVAKSQAALRTCHDRLVRAGVDLDHYTTLDEADDVIDLARGLHLQHLNLQAIWDGARVALAVAHEAPDVVRTMTLVDPEVPRSSFMADPTASLGVAFDRYAALCAADARCHDAYPDLEQTLHADVVGQTAHPELARAADVISGVLRVRVKHPGVLVDGDRLAQGLAAVLTSSLRNMPLLAAGIAHPNVVVNASLAAAQNFPLLLKDFPWGGFLSRMCSYEMYTRSTGAAVAAAARAEYSGYDDPAYQWTCAAWPVAKQPETAFAPVSGDTPTLLVEQGLDPRLEPEAASQLGAGLAHLSVLSFGTLPGGTLPGEFPPCYNTVREQFVQHPDRALDTAGCAAQTPRIAFVTPG
ncbi:MAG TPA: adenylate/guanylate cyclase domain-containing protein, partial [Acidimicrobiia bacterium]|nr:adenylate/guanylate cyclase domain-containing protein [Acidimicrobiia bacterium]